uniref:hypothetical protein n=1 Tax=Microbulbifer agarilyticus TaxID=260552 RepID=UPI00111009AF|nr:hypothetical protein [Microbulbifer agarilyticus]
MESNRAIAAAFEIDASFLEKKPDTSKKENNLRLRAVFGMGGVLFRGIASAWSISSSWINGDIISQYAGISYGLLGLVVGISCAAIGTLARHMGKA